MPASVPRPTRFRRLYVAPLAATALAACLVMTGCDAIVEALEPSIQVVDEKLHVSDKSDETNSYTYCYDTIKTTGLDAARSVFSLAATSCEEEIEISRDLKITEDDMRTAVSTMRFEPDYLCSTGSFSFVVSSPSDSDEAYVSVLRLSYDYDTELVPAYREEMAAAAAAIIDSVITRDMSSYEKALALHDYLVSTCDYDESLQYYSPYDAIVNHTGTCQAYSQAYKLLLERVGVVCDYASSEAMNHSWNMVSIDGLWYHVDVTWDDPIVIGGQLNEIPHTYFLKSDQTMAADKHYDWVADHAAPTDCPA